MVNIPRVLWLLDRISHELKEVREKIPNSNPELEGVFDRLLVYIEVQKKELLSESYSYEKLSGIMKFIANLIEIISRWNDTLYYKVARCLATLNIFRQKLGKYVSRQEYQIIQNQL